MTRSPVRSLLALSRLGALSCLGALGPYRIAAQVVPAPDSAAAEPAITISFVETPVQRVLHTFAEFSGRSIVAGIGVDGAVTASIRDQPWDQALQAILAAQGLSLTETADGILVVTDDGARSGVTESEAVQTRVFKLRWQRAMDLQDVVASMVSERGTVAVAEATNSIVVTDSPQALRRIAAVLGH